MGEGPQSRRIHAPRVHRAQLFSRATRWYKPAGGTYPLMKERRSSESDRAEPWAVT